MTMKEALQMNEAAPWISQAEAAKNKLAAINVELERLRQQMANIRSRMDTLREEKNKLQNPGLYQR